MNSRINTKLGSGQDGRSLFDGSEPLFQQNLSRWKLIETPSRDRTELFDLQRDRRESHDLGTEQIAQVEAMRKALADWVRRSVRTDLEGRSGLDVDAIVRLQELGYLDQARNPAESASEDGDEREVER